MACTDDNPKLAAELTYKDILACYQMFLLSRINLFINEEPYFDTIGDDVDSSEEEEPDILHQVIQESEEFKSARNTSVYRSNSEPGKNTSM